MKLGLFIVWAMVASAVMAAPAEVSESIAKVKTLYAKAYPMEAGSLEKAALLTQAEDILKATIEKHPDALEAYRKLVGVYTLKQDYTGGIKAMQQAILLSPEDPKLFAGLAVFYHKTGALHLADEMLNQALTLQPDYQVAKDFKMVIQKALTAKENAHAMQKPMDAVHSGAPAAKAH